MAPKVLQHKGPTQKPSQGQLNNRRALGDIGNIVSDVGAKNNAKEGIDEKKVPNVGRPVTRSYGARLLANAKAAATAKDSIALSKQQREHSLANVKEEDKPRNRKSTKATEVLPSEIVTVLDSDSDEEDAQIVEIEIKRHARNSRAAPKKVKTSTTTATITARSLAFCKNSDSEQDELPNIDEGDADNPLAVVEYVEDIYKFYRETENMSCVGDYMGNQTEINDKMRAILIDWLTEVHLKFELMPETLYLTTNILDRYLSMQAVQRNQLQLVGITAMLLASKYEEIWAPQVNDFVSISDNAFTGPQILLMEKRMLNKLKFQLTVPTPYVFAVRFLKAARSDSQVKNMTFFLLELSMTRYSTIKFKPSMIAAAAVYAAQCNLHKSPVWTDLLIRHTGYSETNLKGCARLLLNFHEHACESKLKVVHRKYSCAHYGSVALIAPSQLPA